MIISENIDIRAIFYSMLYKEKEVASMFSEAAEKTNDPKLKKILNELEQCARNHHGRILDYLEEKPVKNVDEQRLRTLLLTESDNHRLYNIAMVMVTDLSARQMLQQLRDEKMRSITILQEELKKEKQK